MLQDMPKIISKSFQNISEMNSFIQENISLKNRIINVQITMNQAFLFYWSE